MFCTKYLLSNYPIIFSSPWFMSTICEGCQHVYGFDESLVFPQTPFCHQSFPILSSGLTSLPSPSCNHHNPIADTMLVRLGNNCDNRRSVNIYYLSFIWSWRWRCGAGCRRCRHWQVKRHRQSWTTALLGPSCEYTDYWYSNIHYTDPPVNKLITDIVIYTIQCSLIMVLTSNLCRTQHQSIIDNLIDDPIQR